MTNELSPREHVISPRYERPILSALMAQGVLAILASLLLDGGQAARVLGVALLAFWGTTGFLIARRMTDPTPAMLSWTRHGWIPMVAAVSAIAWVIRT